MPGSLVVVPTYNERENVADLAAAVHRHAPDTHLEAQAGVKSQAAVVIGSLKKANARISTSPAPLECMLHQQAACSAVLLIGCNGNRSQTHYRGTFVQEITPDDLTVPLGYNPVE